MTPSGKTRLLEELRQQASEAGVLVLSVVVVVGAVVADVVVAAADPRIRLR